MSFCGIQGGHAEADTEKDKRKKQARKPREQDTNRKENGRKTERLKKVYICMSDAERD